MTELVVQRGGVHLHVEVHGDGAGVPLLLTHGYCASASMWRANLERLAAGRRVVVWDLRGHGRTVTPATADAYSHDLCVDDMAAVLDAVGIDRAVVGGLSLGGYMSLAFHRRHQGRVAGLVLADTGPGYRRTEHRARWNAFAERSAVSFEQRGLDALPTGAEVGPGPHDPVGLALAARGLLAQHDADVIEWLPSIAVPTLVLVGEHDTLFLEPARYLAAHIAGARLAVLPGAGHAANIDAPQAFDHVVVEFLSEVDAVTDRHTTTER